MRCIDEKQIKALRSELRKGDKVTVWGYVWAPRPLAVKLEKKGLPVILAAKIEKE